MATAISYRGTDSTTHELDEIEHIYNGTSEAIAYKYDTLGMVNSVNRTGMDMLMPAQSSAVYDPANRMVQFGGITINHDANGNPLHLNGMDLTWNQKSQLTHVSGAAAGPIEYKYDAMGRRVSKIVNSVTTNYLYGGMNLIAELDGDNSNAPIAWYVYAGLDRPLARVDASDGSILYYHQDLLGSVIALTNSSGAVVTQYNYSPFGHTQVIGTDIDQPFRFTGREYDAETDMYNYRNRTYSWKMRRFISEDPLRFGAGDVNFYAYVGSNPVNFVDPFGLDTKPAPGSMTSPYGNRTHPVTGAPDTHNAVDYANNVGSPVVAFRGGVVVRIRQGANGAANSVTIRHADGTVMGYSHLTCNLNVDDPIEEGAVIGYTDLSGASTGGHVHIEFFIPGYPSGAVANPTDLIDNANPFPTLE